MKKAYNVYKVYGKTNIKSLVKTFSFALVFGVCFLGLQTQSVAQSTPDLAITGTASQDFGQVKTSLSKVFTMQSEEAISVLRSEKRDIVNSPQPSDSKGEVDRELNLMFLDVATRNIHDGQTIHQGLVTAYNSVFNSRLYVDNKNVGVNLEDVLSRYAALLN